MSKLPKYTAKSWLVTTLSELVIEDPELMWKCNLRFETSEEAIAHNNKEFRRNDYDYTKVTLENSNTIISPGIEF